MKRHSQKPLVRFRFKDNMGCVFFRNFKTEHEARLWYERNKAAYCLKELGSMGLYIPEMSYKRTGLNNMFF